MGYLENFNCFDAGSRCRKHEATVLRFTFRLYVACCRHACLDFSFAVCSLNHRTVGLVYYEDESMTSEKGRISIKEAKVLCSFSQSLRMFLL